MPDEALESSGATSEPLIGIEDARNAVTNWIGENQRSLNIGNFELQDISTGKSNFTYVANGEQKIVVRMSRPPSEDKLEHEAKFLDFLSKNGINEIPAVLRFEKEGLLGQSVIAQTYVGDFEFDPLNAPEEQIDAFAKVIAKIWSISTKAYDKIFSTNTPSQQNLREYLDERFSEYSEKPFKDYVSLSLQPNQAIVDFYERQKKLLQEGNMVRSPMIMVVAHRDLANNIRVSGNEVYLVDWELGGVASPVSEIQHFFNIADIPASVQTNFIEALRRQFPLRDFEKKRDILKKFLLFNDMIWAAQRQAALYSQGSSSTVVDSHRLAL